MFKLLHLAEICTFTSAFWLFIYSLADEMRLYSTWYIVVFNTSAPVDSHITHRAKFVNIPLVRQF